MRISATDWTENGWDLEQSIELSRRLKQLGVDLVDVSSGGAVPGVRIPVGPGYQVGFAATIRREAGIATGAVGMISEPGPGGNDHLDAGRRILFCWPARCFAIPTGRDARRTGARSENQAAGAVRKSVVSGELC